MDDDWDLQAVVRGCCTTTTTTATTPSFAMGFHSFSTFQPPQQAQENNKLICLQDLYEPRNDNTSMEYLHDLWKPFVTKAKPSPPPPPPPSLPPPPPPRSPQSVPVSPLSVLSGLQDLSSQQNQQQVQHKQHHVQPQRQLYQPKQLAASSGVHKTTTHKRRKNQMKRVCQVAAEGLSSDMWSWRKYGQKPIKGSPYPRGYYRCSTSKGCLARKQVERNRSDPNMFIVTYTAEHNHPMPTHRNSLAGISRQKPEIPPTTETVDPNKPIFSPAANLSPVPENLDVSMEEKGEDEDDFSISDVPLDDDFFIGLDDELTGLGPAQGDSFSDNLPQRSLFPWLSNNATTTTAGGGG